MRACSIFNSPYFVSQSIAMRYQKFLLIVLKLVSLVSFLLIQFDSDKFGNLPIWFIILFMFITAQDIFSVILSLLTTAACFAIAFTAFNVFEDRNNKKFYNISIFFLHIYIIVYCFLLEKITLSKLTFITYGIFLAISSFTCWLQYYKTKKHTGIV